MAFPTLVADPGDPSANTYADASAADAYLAYRVGASAWAGYSADLKAQALVSATRDIDTLDFIGERATDDQALEWPRTGTDYADDALPQRLVDATIELAFSYAQQVTADATSDVLNPVPDNIKREKTGPLETEYFAPTAPEATALERLPAIVQRLLAPLLRTPVVGQWGSALVLRGS